MAPDGLDAGLELAVERGSVGCAHVAARGELDLFSGLALRQTLGELIASGRTMISLDLTGLAFIDSAGHRSIGAAADLAEGLGGEVRLGGCSPNVRRFLDLTSSVLAIAPHADSTSGVDANHDHHRLPRSVGF